MPCSGSPCQSLNSIIRPEFSKPFPVFGKFFRAATTPPTPGWNLKILDSETLTRWCDDDQNQNIQMDTCVTPVHLHAKTPLSGFLRSTRQQQQRAQQQQRKWRCSLIYVVPLINDSPVFLLTSLFFYLPSSTHASTIAAAHCPSSLSRQPILQAFVSIKLTTPRPPPPSPPSTHLAAVANSLPP